MTLYEPVTPDQLQRKLSDIDRQIVTLLAAGLTHKEIGQAMGYAPHTMKNRVYQTYRRVGLRGSAALVAWALLTDNVNRDDVRELLTQRYPHLMDV